MARTLYRDDQADARLARTSSLAQYLPHILLYPFTGFCLPVLILAAVAVGIGVQSLFGISLIVIVGSWTLYYLISIVEHSAQGHATPPPLRGEAMHVAGSRTLGALILPLLLATASHQLMQSGHSSAAALVPMLGMLVLPANFLLLALHGEALGALNPLGWLQVMGALGPAYLVAPLALAASLLLPIELDGAAGFMLATLVACYAAFMSAHLLGFLAYHRRARLGFDARVRHPEVVAREQEQAQRLQTLLARIDAQLQRGDAQAAMREIAAEPGGPADVPGFHEELFGKLLTRGAPALVHTQGRRYITLLLNANRPARALEIYETCWRRHPHFEPETPLQVGLLAQQALAQGFEQLFVQLTADLERRYPGDPVYVDSGLMAARYWSQQKNDDARARELIRPLIAHKQHPRHAQVMALARTLMKLEKS